MVAALLERLQDLPVLEVGPGTGVLTGRLLAAGVDLYAVEIDTRLAGLLVDTFPPLKGRIIIGDFLKYDFADFEDKPVAVIGNFPYNISSQIMLRIFQRRQQVPLVVGMFQKEMAQRLAAPAGNKAYGILSVLLQAVYDIRYLFDVRPTCFVPPPRVNSAVIRLERRQPQPQFNEEHLRRLLRAAFGQRRKRLRNSLQAVLLPELLLADRRMTLRPEQLTVDEWLQLAADTEAYQRKHTS